MLSSVKLASPTYLLLLAPAAVERTLVERALTLTSSCLPAAVELTLVEQTLVQLTLSLSLTLTSSCLRPPQ